MWYVWLLGCVDGFCVESPGVPNIQCLRTLILYMSVLIGRHASLAAPATVCPNKVVTAMTVAVVGSPFSKQ